MTVPRRPSRPRKPRPPARRVGPRRPPVEDPPRRAALDALAAVRERDAYANLVLPTLLRQRGIGGRDAALATELCYGTSRAQGLLDAVLQACADRPLATVDGELLDALRLGSYQLLRTRVPAHAAVAATVELVRAGRGSGAAGFVNAVLRRVAKQDENAWIQVVAPGLDDDPVGHLAMAQAHPRWIAQAFADALGGDLDELAAALVADDVRPLVHLAARPGQISAAELAAATGGQPAPYSPYGVHLAEGGDPGELAAVRNHLAQVQDEGSQLVTLALAGVPLAVPDARWLDLCAGPGGKGALLGALAAIRGATLDAVEKAEHRARLVSQACVGLPVTVHVADGRDSGLPERTFDRVLVDVPCTGLGALRRRPEARWRRRSDEVAGLVRLQRELLLAALRLVRPGGVVAYVTCSPHRDETVGVVADVLRRTAAEQLDARPGFPGVPLLGEGPHVQLWPHRHGTDAMFCALLRRSVSRAR
ncbi:MAG TPA: RsmB/NOP family class I SAM-dependent RNA methyltransferase [Pseudonocardiaceae bacterium]|nr:RsmB/NOP family class I SAM-dependent RNA methyltransferase [Pseudonocardiaceae bacterium]